MMERRKFIKAAAGMAAAALGGGCRSLFRRGAPQAVRQASGAAPAVACVGVGGRGALNLAAVCAAGGRPVALCDVDETLLLAARERLAQSAPDVRLYRDFRVLLESERTLDAVVVSTPDHGHGIQAAWALEKGCAVYLETPLVRTLGELRRLREQARARRAVVMAGDTGRATGEFRRAVELVASGLLGTVSEIHAWTSRPVWPQGMARPEGSDRVPPELDWELWLCGAEARPFKNKAYHRFNWRAWHDFGTGALGDAGTQMLGLPFQALELGPPAMAEASGMGEPARETYPRGSTVRFVFPSRGKRRPAVTLQWYEGLCRPAADRLPEVLSASGPLPASGCLLVGDKGVWLASGDSGTRHALALSGEGRLTDFERHEAGLAIAQALPRAAGQMEEFLGAVRHGKETFSSLSALTPVTECLLVGCAAQRAPGVLAWESARGRLTVNGAACGLAEPALRAGWEMGRR